MGLEYIKKRKKELNMTTEELSSISGVPIGTLNKILAGQTYDPKFETLRSICRALGIKLSDLDDFPYSSPDLTEDEQKLLSLFNQLNAEGRSKVLEYVEDIAGNRRYTEDDSELLKEA